jgi:DNA-binding MarR family transcriptional regulator
VLPGGPDAVRLGLLENTLGFHLRLAQEASFAAFARRAGTEGLKPGHFATLVVIHENAGLSQTALGAAVGRDKSTLTPRLAELEARGLIRRDRAVADRRSYALSLTPAGEEALSVLTAHAAAHDRALDRLVGAENRDAFCQALRRLTAGLETDET